jgi:hypothetical protein
MGGVSPHFVGVNDFFTVAELRCRILNQITAEEHDDTATNLLSVQVFGDWLRNGLHNIGQQVTFRDIMKLLFQYIHYDVIPNPAAKFVDSTDAKSTTTVKGQTYEVGKSPSIVSISKTLDDHISYLQHQTASPTDNIPSIVGIATNISAELGKAITTLTALAASNASAASSATRVKDYLQSAKSTVDKLKNGDTTSWSPFGPALVDLIQARNALGAMSGTTKSADRTVSDARSQQLHTQIIRPDCWFAPPPVCNVIFPEQYTQFTFDRNYVSEVTRSLVMVYPWLVGPDALIAERFLAPNIGFPGTDLEGKYLEGAHKVVGREDSYRVLMKHERHIGIIARSEWLSNVSAGASKLDPGSKDSLKHGRLLWAERVALFQFFKYRFAPRILNVSGRFNPGLVCGFPGAVIRAPYRPTQPASYSETDALDFALGHAAELGAPSHFVGMISSVMHSVDQNGGNSSVAMHHVRQHNGVDDEFLGVMQSVKQPSTTKVVKVVLRWADLSDKDVKLRKLMEDVTPQGSDSLSKSSSSSSSVKVVTSSAPIVSVDPTSGGLSNSTLQSTHTIVQETDAPPTLTAPTLTARSRLRDVGDSVLVPSPNGRIAAGDVGKGFFPGSTLVGVEVLGDGSSDVDPTTGRRHFAAVALYERVVVPITSNLPVEEIIRPTSWFSPKYSNTRVGSEIYEPFFGCASVIDGLTASTGGPASPTTTTVAPKSGSDSKDLSTDPKASLSFVSAVEASKLVFTIERALNSVAYIYGKVKTAGMDVDAFISQYNSRSIATLRQMFGDLDSLSFDIAGDGSVSVEPTADGSTPSIGFHTMAIHPQLVQHSRLAGLMDDPTLPLKRINEDGAASAVPPAYDVRSEKYERVMTYLVALKKGPAFVG